MQILLNVKGLIDVEREVVLQDAFVLIQGNRIIDWGRSSDMPVPGKDTANFKLADQYLLPGLINSHAHLCLPSAGTPFDRRQSDEMALLTAVRNMQIELHSGVTTVRDCGDQNGVLFHLRGALEKDILTGPRLLLCGPPLTRTAGHAHFLGGQADGPENIGRSVQQRIEDGADFVKLMATGGSTPGTDPARASYTVEEIAAAVDAAHVHGRPVAAHCRGIPGIRAAIDAGVDQIEHACFELPDGRLAFDPELAERIARSNMFVTPTIQLYRDARDFLQRKLVDQGLSAEESERLKRSPAAIAEKYRTLRAFVDLGVKCVAGSDAGLPQTGFGQFWKELDAMICGGMTPMQAIVSATRTAAEAMRVDNAVGTIGKGKKADLLVVEDNPVQDIRALEKVKMVIKGGKVVFEKK